MFKRNVATAFLIIAVFLSVIYSNAFDGAWHLDDYPNILENPRIQIDRLTPERIKQTFFAQPLIPDYRPGSLYRPVAMMTFGLNWYLGQDRVFGYHVVNLAVHVVNTFLLFMILLHLLKSPVLNIINDRLCFSIALIGALLWGIHPVQTQPVNYIVQRMTLLAVCFYFTGILCFIKGRLSTTPGLRMVFFCVTVIAYGLALGSKENAVTLPAALLMIEAVFFKKREFYARQKKAIILFGFFGVAGAVIAGWYLLDQKYDYFKSGYQRRPFTLQQRLLTEPRVVVFYLSQIMLPNDDKFSIHHDVVISTGLTRPATTVLSIIAVFALIGLGGVLIFRQPAAAFALLFFFLNHLLESTVIPLELIYEHRNYLPSAFMFFPAALWFVTAFQRYRSEKPAMAVVMAFGIVLILMTFGIGTYARNMAWATAKTLWEDAVKKAPDSARPLHNLAVHHYEKIGDDDQALALYRQAIAKNSSVVVAYPAMGLTNMANIYMRKGDFRSAESAYETAVQFYPGYDRANIGLAYAFLYVKDCGRALDVLNRFIGIAGKNPEYLLHRARHFIRMGYDDDAIMDLQTLLGQTSRNHEAFLLMGFAHIRQQRFAEAARFLTTAAQDDVAAPVAYALLVNAGVQSDNHDDVDQYRERLFTRFTQSRVETAINDFCDDIAACGDSGCDDMFQAVFQ